MEDKTIINIEFIKQSSNRLKILKVIGEDSLKPSDISKKTKIHINNVSRSLKQMREKEIVYLLNPDSKRDRLYKLTEDGLEVLKNLK